MSTLKDILGIILGTAGKVAEGYGDYRIQDKLKDKDIMGDLVKLKMQSLLQNEDPYRQSLLAESQKRLKEGDRTTRGENLKLNEIKKIQQAATIEAAKRVEDFKVIEEVGNKEIEKAKKELQKASALQQILTPPSDVAERRGSPSSVSVTDTTLQPKIRIQDILNKIELKRREVQEIEKHGGPLGIGTEIGDKLTQQIYLGDIFNKDRELTLREQAQQAKLQDPLKQQQAIAQYITKLMNADDELTYQEALKIATDFFTNSSQTPSDNIPSSEDIIKGSY